QRYVRERVERAGGRRERHADVVEAKLCRRGQGAPPSAAARIPGCSANTVPWRKAGQHPHARNRRTAKLPGEWAELTCWATAGCFLRLGGGSLCGGSRAESVALKISGRPMEIDLPDVVAEVTREFERYEQALVTNDVALLDALFRDDPRTIRYGIAENLYGHEQIKAFRAARAPAGLARTLSQTVITTYGRDVGIASTLFHRAGAAGKVGRQMQTWVRFPEGWRVVAAHVSVIDAPD